MTDTATATATALTLAVTVLSKNMKISKLRRSIVPAAESRSGVILQRPDSIYSPQFSPHHNAQ